MHSMVWDGPQLLLCVNYLPVSILLHRFFPHGSSSRVGQQSWSTAESRIQDMSIADEETSMNRKTLSCTVLRRLSTSLTLGCHWV
jgi:hypothetical protein